MKSLIKSKPFHAAAFFLGLVLIVASFLLLLSPDKDKNDTSGHRNDLEIEIEGVTLNTQIAETISERSIGLSQHSHLENNEAMLFVFSHSAPHGFWMKDMSFPIDIFWLNDNKDIIFIKKNARPEDFPESYQPNAPARYVVETVAGFAERNTVSISDTFSW